MKKANTSAKAKSIKLNQLIEKLGLVPDRFYGHLLFTVGTIVDNGKKELRARAEKGFSKVIAQLNIPTNTEVAKLQSRIMKLEQRLNTDLGARAR